MDGLRQRDALQDRTKRNYLEQLGRSMAWRLWDLAMNGIQDSAGCCLGKSLNQLCGSDRAGGKDPGALRASSDKLICKELP